jgi:hypothetical protein
MQITTVDVLMAFLGLAGFTTVLIVMASAFSKVNKFEHNRKGG